MRRFASRRLRAAFLALLASTALSYSESAHAQQVLTTAGDVRIHYWPGQQRLAALIARSAQAQRFRGLPDSILDAGVPVELFIAPDPARFDSLTGGRAPEWGAGVAMPLRNMIVVPGYVSPRTGVHELGPVVRHELAHVALQRHLRDARVPRWFTEGYATWVAGEFDEREGWLLRLSFLTGAAPPLDSLILDWPELAPDARMAYLLSASAVRYLHSLGDEAAFTRFLELWRDTGSLEQSLRTVYVITSSQFERLWIAHVKRTYGWTQVFAQSMFVWLVLTLLVLVLFVIRRRRDRRRMRGLRAAELPDSPAYWLEPPNGVATEGEIAGGGVAEDPAADGGASPRPDDPQMPPGHADRDPTPRGDDPDRDERDPPRA